MFHILLRSAGAALVNAAAPSLVIVAIACTSMYARGWSAATRYVMWWFALFAVVLLPFLSMRKHQEGPATVPIRLVPASRLPSSPALPAHPPISAADIVGFVCCGLALVQSTRLVLALSKLLLLKRGVTVTSKCKRRGVRIGTSAAVSVPLAAGYFRPMVILPAHLKAKLEPHELDQVIAHELAHLSRFDDWAIALQQFIGALFAFHPLVQFIGWRMSVDREIACDDRVIASAKPAHYAASLTKVAEALRFSNSPALAVPLLARKSNLARRIENMLDNTRSHVPLLSMSRAFSFAMVCAVIMLGGVRAPSLIASHLFDQSPDDLGPIIFALPDGSQTTFEANGAESQRDSALPRGTILFKKHGKSYLIRDKVTIDQSTRMLETMQHAARKQGELGEKQRRLGEQQLKLAERMRIKTEFKLDEATRKMIEEQVREAQQKLSTIDMQKALESAHVAQEEIAKMQFKFGDMQAKIAEDLAKAGIANGQLGEEQGKLGAQQGRLGELQGQLGEQQAREAKRIERELRQLIERAQKQGLAQPLQ